MSASEHLPESRPPLARRPIAWIAVAVVAVLAVVGAVVWVAAGTSPGKAAAALTIGDTAIDLEPVLVPEPAALALAELGEPGYVALHPFAVSDPNGLPAGEGELTAELPAALPEGAIATFAYYDADADGWMPTATTVAPDLRTITSVVTVDPTNVPTGSGAGGKGVAVAASSRVHSAVDLGAIGELWTVVVVGATEAVQDGFAAAGAAIEDVVETTGEEWNTFLTDWGTDLARGSAWMQRATHQLLGNAADMPECEPDSEGVVPWVAEIVRSDNAEVSGLGIEGGNAAVLLCAGPDPDDTSLLQFKAAANRAYGFPVALAEGIEPVWAGMESLEPSTGEILGAAYSVVANGASLLLNPGSYILPGQTYAISVGEQNVRASQNLTATTRIVEFPMPSYPEVWLSGTLGAALDELQGDAFAGALGVLILAKDCDFTQWNPEDWAGMTNGVSTCVGALESETLEKVALDLSGKLKAGESESAQKVATFIDGGRTAAKAVLGKLGWMALFAASQTLTDYFGDVGTEDVSSMPAWYAGALLNAPAPAWEDFAGTWCFATGTGCWDYKPGRSDGFTIEQTGMADGCFVGLGSDDMGSGATFVYCPADVPTPSIVPGWEPGEPVKGDNPAFERLFVYQGYGNVALFREADLAAATAG